MIEGWIGRPGAGKTYTLTERALQARRRGVEVFANYPIRGCWLFGPEDLLHLPPGLIVIDEAHLWFPARQALRLPPSWLAGLSQTRKNGWSLIWSAQHETRVDRVLRDVSSWFWLTEAWFRTSEGHPRLFSLSSWEPEFFRKPERRQTRRIVPFRKSVARAYDTYGRIEVAKHFRRDDDAYDPAVSP